LRCFFVVYFSLSILCAGGAGWFWIDLRLLLARLGLLCFGELLRDKSIFGVADFAQICPRRKAKTYFGLGGLMQGYDDDSSAHIGLNLRRYSALVWSASVGS